MGLRGPKCSICLSPERHEFERQTRKLGVKRGGLAALAKSFGFSDPAARRHLDGCLKGRVQQVMTEKHANRDLISGIGLAEATYELHERTLAILSDAEKTKDLRTALAAIREARENLSQLGDWNGKTKGAATVNVVNLMQHPDMQRIAAVHEQLTREFPEAGARVAQLMRESAGAIDVKAIGGGRR